MDDVGEDVERLICDVGAEMSECDAFGGIVTGDEDDRVGEGAEQGLFEFV